jgi:hypothetical protein
MLKRDEVWRRHKYGSHACMHACLHVPAPCSDCDRATPAPRHINAEAPNEADRPGPDWEWTNGAWILYEGSVPPWNPHFTRQENELSQQPSPS